MLRKMAYLSICASLIGAGMISIDLGVFQLSLFRMAVLLMLYVIAVKMLFEGKGVSIGGKSENSYSIYFMVIWFAYAVMTIGWVRDYEGWVRAVYFICLGVICVLIFNKIFKTGFEILIAFRVIGAMAVFHNLIGWYELITGNYMFLPADRVAVYVNKSYPVSMFGNTNDFSTFMLISCFIIYICAANSKLPGKVICYATMTSSAYLLLMTRSRANILGFIFSLLLFLYLTLRGKKGRQAVMVLFTMLLLFILVTPGTLDQLLSMLVDILNFDFSKGTGSEATRINLIKNGFYFLLETFGMGTGAGNIEYWMRHYSIYNTSNISNIHNWWAEVLTGYGLIIFAMYAIFYIGLFTSIYKKYRKSKNRLHRSISTGILCSMAGFLIGSMSSSSNINCEWLWVFWAIVIAYQGLNVENELERKAGESREISRGQYSEKKNQVWPAAR